MDLYRANIWFNDKQMDNIVPASSDEPQECCKNIYVHYKVAQLCINEGCCNTVNSDYNLENEISYIPSDITEAAISGHSVLRSIIVQELAQRDLERPTFN